MANTIGAAREGVLVVGEDLTGSGGLGRMGVTQMRILNDLGWHITPITPKDIPRVWRSGKFPALNAALMSWQLSCLGRQASSRKRALFSHGLCGAAGGRGKQVQLYHGTCAGNATANRPGLSRAEFAILRHLMGLLEQRSGKHAVGIACSNMVARETQRFYGLPHVRPVYNAVDVEHFTPDGPATRHRPEGSFVGLCVGRLDFGKGREIVRQLGELLPADHSMRLASPIVQGNAGWTPERLHMLGAVSYADLPDVYRSSDYLLCASRYEGFALTLFEAWTCGRPVVTTNVGIVAELRGLEPAFDQMVVDDLDDAQGFADRIRLLRENPEIGRRQVEWGRQLAVDRFSLTRYRHDYQALLESWPD